MTADPTEKLLACLKRECRLIRNEINDIHSYHFAIVFDKAPEATELDRVHYINLLERESRLKLKLRALKKVY